MSLSKKSLPLVIACLLTSPLARFADAATKTWIGGNVDWVDGTGGANWSPAGEPGPGDAVIFNTANAVNLGSNNEVLSLAMSGGIDLDTNGHNLLIDGSVTAGGSSTNLVADGAASTLTARSFTLNSGGVLSMRDGHVVLADPASTGILTINSGASVLGTGFINLNNSLASPTSLLLNEGTISAEYNPGGIIISIIPLAGTLTIGASSGNARIDLDGNSGAGIVNVFRNQTLQINGTVADGFSGSMSLYQNSTLNISNPWGLDVGTIDIHSGATGGLFGAPADTSYIAGGAFTQSGGVITVADNDGTLEFDAPFTMSGGSLTNNGLVVFNNNATVGSSASFTMPTNTSSITVNPNVTVSVNQAFFNADGNGTNSNVLTINSGGLLAFSNGVAGGNELDGTIHLNGGTLRVNTSTGNWDIAGPVATGAGTGTSNINGDTLTLTSTTVNVATGSTLIFGAQTVWITGGKLAIAAGGTARFNANTEFDFANTITGAGTLQFASNANFNTGAVINMPSGTVNLTAATGLFPPAHTITFSDNVTINASTLVSFGFGHLFGNDTMNISGSGFNSLWVFLTDPAGEWTLNASAILNVSAVGGMLGGGGIQGSDFFMAGTANVGGNSIWTARTDISGTMNVFSGGSINFRGGTLAKSNTLQGGSITGAGALNALGNVALTGFGTIDTSIDFPVGNELRADNGTLTITGNITEVGIIGTADTDGILNVSNAWNTSVADTRVELKGGQIIGSAITNGGSGGIVGQGLVSARVINNTHLDANTAGTLIFQTSGNNDDWDGTPNAGTLNASNTGTLELHDNADFSFFGTVNANNGTVSTVGFAFQLQPGSTLHLTNGGVLSESAGLNTGIGGTFLVSAGADSRLLTTGATGTFTFLSGNTTTLTGNLQLDSVLTIIQTGATFSGAGSLINLATRTLAPDNLAVANILLDNRGILSPAGTSPGRFDVHDFQQSATGALALNFNGPGLNQFDRLIINGSAQLDGALDLSLGAGFAPSLGNAFIVLSATGGIANTFATVNSPAPIGGLLHFIFTPTYNPTNVTLTVTRAYYEVQSGPYPQNFTGGGYELVKTTANTATVSGNSSFTGLTSVLAGTLIATNQNALGSGGLDIEPAATAQLGAGINLVLKLPSLTIAHTGSTYTGTFDLTDGKFILQSTGGADKLSKISDLNNALMAGSNGGAWTGAGITSSTAAVNAAHYGVGLFDNALLGLTTIGTQTLDPNSLLVAIAHLGDANHNGVVDIQDLTLIANNWQKPANNWAAGDLNLDGLTDIQDFTIIANNWQQTSSFTLSPSAAQAPADAPLQSIIPVPEPATLAILSAIPLFLLRRRFHRRLARE